jgi:hypothetical protein
VLYRVTIDVDADVADEWIAWMKEVHVPDVLREPGFSRAVIAREKKDDATAVRFVIDYTVESNALLDRYFAESAPRVRAEHEARFGGRARATRQVLEIVASL